MSRKLALFSHNAYKVFWMVTGGGKLITNHTTALARLTGGQAQPEEA